MSESKQVDVVVVGAGFGGMYMLHRLKSAGLNVQVIERGDGVGGTWYWNRYPGARVDIQSMEYSYQFSEDLQQEWEWSERYSPQPEILAYANHVADRFDLRSSILFETEVVTTRFDEESSRWQVETDNGRSFDAQFCVMATGCLSSTNLPAFEGLDSFAGDWYHTGLWPHERVDFTGKRVGLIGTGSSAIQTIPQVAKEAGHLTVFQRTANYSIPAHNQDLDPEFVDEIKSQYKDFRAANKLEHGGFGSRTERNDGSVFDASEFTADR
jgi:cation diffusion facilitator CzcD-associated flavoprotein CzcO